jgi:hypothetical protein
VTDHEYVSAAVDLHATFPDGRVIGPVDLAGPDEQLCRLFAELTSPTSLLIASPSAGDFSWEFVNRLISREPRLTAEPAVDVMGDVIRLSSQDFALALLPALLSDQHGLTSAHEFAEHVVIMVRKGITRVAEVGALAKLLGAVGFTVHAVVIVESEHRRWRKWRRFAHTYGVWADPERPWPAIDVLDEEMARSARSRRSRAEQ